MSQRPAPPRLGSPPPFVCLGLSPTPFPGSVSGFLFLCLSRARVAGAARQPPRSAPVARDTATFRKSLQPLSPSCSPGGTRLIPPSSGHCFRLRVAHPAARSHPRATELPPTPASLTGVQLLPGPRAALYAPALPLPVPAPGGRPRDAWDRAPSRVGADPASPSRRWLGYPHLAEELGRAPGG